MCEDCATSGARNYYNLLIYINLAMGFAALE